MGAYAKLQASRAMAYVVVLLVALLELTVYVG
jgi:hypothetical protein